MTISIICPTYNEEHFVAQTVKSFLAQELSGISLEVLVVDGMSTDKTREIVRALQVSDSRLKLIDNPERKTPFAFNRGLKEAAGEYVAILGAHASYASNYIQSCYDELVRTGSVGCTGKIISKAAAESPNAQYVEWILENPFGVSGSSFRTIAEGYVHSVNFAVFRKDALLALGGYDVALSRNQDNDMNQRLLDAGHKLYCTWKTHCYYFPQSSLNKLFRYAYNNGYWNVASLGRNRRSMRLYHFVPFIFLITLIGSAVLGIGEVILLKHSYLLFLSILVLIVYMVVASVFTFRSIVKQFDIRKIVLPFLFLSFHLSYGWGSLRGFTNMLWLKKS